MKNGVTSADSGLATSSCGWLAKCSGFNPLHGNGDHGVEHLDGRHHSARTTDNREIRLARHLRLFQSVRYEETKKEQPEHERDETLQGHRTVLALETPAIVAGVAVRFAQITSYACAALRPTLQSQTIRTDRVCCVQTTPAPRSVGMLRAAHLPCPACTAPPWTYQAKVCPKTTSSASNNVRSTGVSRFLTSKCFDIARTSVSWVFRLPDAVKLREIRLKSRL